MTTEKLYYKNAYQREFTAAVLDCRQGKKGYEVILSATAFYPEGGGQPWDTGTLEEVCGERRKASVLEVQEKEGEIIHYTNRPLEIGALVFGKICWERRFDLMQQHSGEHIVSGLIHKKYGCDNVGFHLGSDVVTIDFNCEIKPEELPEIEAAANSLIWQNRETHIFYPSQEELDSLDYRSKKELTGEVRIVEFPGGDVCACCGLHPARSGEIGIIKLLSSERFREGVRIEMISGGRVLNYLNTVNAQNHQISVLLSAKPDRTSDAVKRLSEENFHLKGRVLALEEALFAQKAALFSGAGDVLLFEKGLEADSVRKLAVAVMETCGGRCALFSDNNDGSFKYALGEKGGDLRGLVKEMNQALNGRGGGKPFFAQGFVRASEAEIREFFAKQSRKISGQPDRVPGGF